jgi:hypothetical protein
MPFFAAQRAQGLSSVAVEMHSEITASDSAYVAWQ